MPICVCRTECQVRLDSGKIKWFQVGDTATFEKCPVHFESLEGTSTVDFASASDAELLQVKWKKSDAKAFIESQGGTLKDFDGISKADIVDQIIDARYRKVD